MLFKIALPSKGKLEKDFFATDYHRLNGFRKSVHQWLKRRLKNSS
jgi:hypothetical protein